MAQIMGVGTGVFIISFFGVLFGIFCLVASRTKYARSVTLTCAGVYSMLLIILLLMPRSAHVEQDSAVTYNSVGILRRFMIAYLGLMGLSGIVTLVSDRLFTVRVARCINYSTDVAKVG
eukprot:jgi/Ulvmu1/12822/UM098_0003.1